MNEKSHSIPLLFATTFKPGQVYYHHKVKPMTIKILCRCGLLCLGLLWLSHTASAAPPALKEYQLKAVFLLHYGKFIRWPEQAFAGRNDPFRLCVLGEHPFRQALDAAVAEEKIRGRRIELRYTFLADHLQDCHTLFISRSEQPRLSAVLKRVRHRPILTVSDMDSFISQEGNIQFFTQGHNVRFMLNLQQVRELGLEPNANLLRIARLVKKGERP